jgi:hypothetical protein
MPLQPLQGPWPPHSGGFVILIKTLGRTLLNECPTRRKAFTYTGEHNTGTQRQTSIHASSSIRTHDPSNQAAKTHAFDRAAIGTGMKF